MTSWLPDSCCILYKYLIKCFQIAVVSADDRQMTYRELNDVTDTVAAALRHRGVRPESMVGIYMERSLEYTISYIAILKAGL